MALKKGLNSDRWQQIWTWVFPSGEGLDLGAWGLRGYSPPPEKGRPGFSTQKGHML